MTTKAILSELLRECTKTIQKHDPNHSLAYAAGTYEQMLIEIVSELSEEKQVAFVKSVLAATERGRNL